MAKNKLLWDSVQSYLDKIPEDIILKIVNVEEGDKLTVFYVGKNNKSDSMSLKYDIVDNKIKLYEDLLF